jgi:hypothetical protein
MNFFWGNATFCTAVIFTSDIATSYKFQRANCWLKYYVFVSRQNGVDSAAAYLDNNGDSRK